MEKLRNLFGRNRELSGDITKLELAVSNFTSNLSPGRQEKLLDIEGENVKIYHVGSEKRYKPGLRGDEIKTGNEAVFVEFKKGENIYHLNGLVDPSGKFLFSNAGRFEQGRYRRISINGHGGVVNWVNYILQTYNFNK